MRKTELRMKNEELKIERGSFIFFPFPPFAFSPFRLFALVGPAPILRFSVSPFLLHS